MNIIIEGNINHSISHNTTAYGLHWKRLDRDECQKYLNKDNKKEEK